MNHEHHSAGKRDNRLHLLIMVLCCLIPIAVIVALIYANIGGEYLYFLLILLCPLMHFLLMLPRRKKNPQKSDE